MREPTAVKPVALMIDDEPDLLESCARILEDEALEVVTTTDSAGALELARRVRPNVVVTDFKMPGKSGMDILREIRAEFPHTPVVMISAYATIPGVVDAVKLGAFNYLTKPFSSDQLIVVVRQALESNRLLTEIAELKGRLRDSFFESAFVGKHPRFLKVVEMIKKVAATNSSVLIHGETGAGKEMVGRAIHLHGPRADKPFIVVDCATLNQESLEASGAPGNGDGAPLSVFEAADGGTLYLEKAESLDLGMQARLLRIMQEKQIQLHGKWEWKPVDVRMIASATSDLHEAMVGKKFRENLYYCLSVVNIHIPLLRERKEDIGILCDHFLKSLAAREGSAPKTLSHETLTRLMEYDWPGNVRELKNVIETAAALCDGPALALGDLPEHIRETRALRGLSYREAKRRWLEQLERRYLENLLTTNKGNISRASEEAGIARMSLYRMLKRNNLSQLADMERGDGKNHPGAKYGKRKGKR